MKRRVTAVVVCALFTGVLGGLPARPASADPAGGPPDDLMTVQMRLIAAADRIRPSMAGTSGLAGITIEAEVGQVRIYWKGELPPPVREAIDAEGRIVDVRVISARHSEQELLAAGTDILAEPEVTGVGPLPDGNALLVSVAGDEESARDLPAIRNSSVPVVIAPFERPIFAAGRQADVSPYSGGSMYHRPLGNNFIGVCTTGFAVQVGNQRKMLSAGHCADDGMTVYEGNGSGPTVAMGQISGTSKPFDTLLIDADSAGAVFYGPYTSTLKKPVHLVINNYVNTLVCTSGAMTGQHCGIRITSVNQAIKLQDDNDMLYTVFGLVRAEHKGKTVAAGKGDSGGPVLAQDSIPADVTNIYPLGTITAIDPNSAWAACGPALNPNTICSWKMWYADINLSLPRYAATIVS